MKENLIQERSFKFALKIIGLYGELKTNREFVISKQLLRSGTSIAANIEEAQAGISRSDFIFKMSLACKECRETRFWLRLLKESNLVPVNVDHELQESHEILKILYRIIKTSQLNLEKEKSIRKSYSLE